MKRLVVHIGAPKTATSYIQSRLYRNTKLLAQSGVYLPTTGRLELAPRSVAHHHLAWQFTDEQRFRPHIGGWEALAEEIKSVDTDTVLLSSEEIGRVIWASEHGPELMDRITGLCDQITVVFVVRDQISLINSFFAQRVKMMTDLPTFRVFAERMLNIGWFDYATAFGDWYSSDAIDFVAVPFNQLVTDDPLVSFLRAAEIEVPENRLELSKDVANVSLGPVGILATRRLAQRLREIYPDFSPYWVASRKLHRLAARHSRKQGWCEDKFWGWRPPHAAQAAERLRPANERFAQAVWGTDWPLPMPVDKPRTAVKMSDLDKPTVQKVNRFVQLMTGRFAELHKEYGDT